MGKIGNLFNNVINCVLKLSEFEKTTEGRTVDFEKLLKIPFSPSSFEIAYFESAASFIPKAETCIKCFKLCFYRV